MKRSVIFLLPFFLASCAFFPSWSGGTGGAGASGTGESEADAGPVFRETQSKEEKIAEAKRRMNLRAFIRKGDYFSKRNDLEKARINYDYALSKVGGNDRMLQQRLADVLYESKDFSGAYEHYKTLPLKEIDAQTKDRFFQSFMFDEAVQDRQKELDAMPFDSSEKDYYSYVGSCYTGIHNCVVRLEAYQGEEPRLKELVASVKDYGNVSEDFQYRNALLAGTFFKQKQYLAAAKIAEEIVSNRPDYRSVLKIAGFSRLELGDYEKANGHLKHYFAFEPKDVEAAYSLGFVNSELGDYATSNLYYNNAVLNGYRPKTELERRLIYNSYLMGDRKGMFKVFRYLLDEADVTKEDYEIAVFTTIEEREFGKAYLWADKGVTKFPDDSRLVAMRGWVSRLRGEDENAVRDFTAAMDKNRNDPIALLQMGLLFLGKNEYPLAKSYLEAAKKADPSGTFGDDAETALEDLAKREAAATAAEGSGSTLSGTVISGGTR